VIRDYKKAKSLVVPQHHDQATELLARVLTEVNHIIATFRSELLVKLDNSKAYLEDQQRVIGYLMDLDCPEDPAW
jgi:hypothetical protein